MNEREFMENRQAAMDKMREMNSRSRYKNEPHSPHFEQKEKTAQAKAYSQPHQPKKITQPQPKGQREGGMKLPFLDNLLNDGDSTLILGLLLLLMSEKADKTLIFALVYILL